MNNEKSEIPIDLHYKAKGKISLFKTSITKSVIGDIAHYRCFAHSVNILY